MALLLYPNISGLEMVLFFVVVGFSFFNFTVAKKSSNLNPSEWFHPHLDFQGVRTPKSPGLGIAHSTKTVLTRVQKLDSSKKKNKNKNSKSAADR